MTDNKKQQEEERNDLLASESLYRDLVETSQDLIWQCDHEGTYTFLNPAWEAVFGYSIKEMLGKKFTDFQTAEYAQHDQQEFTRLMDGNIVKGLETIHIGKDGRTINLIFNAKFVRDSDGRIVGTRGTAYDVTERRRIEEALRSSERKFRTVFDNAAVGIVITNRERRVIDSNAAFQRMLGYSHEELMGKILADISEPEDEERGVMLLNEALARKQEFFSMEKKYYRKNGSIMRGILSVSLIPHSSVGDEAIIGMVEDITERRRIEEAMLNAQKIESIGVLAGGIAHDFNNLLTAIIGNISFAKMHVQPDSKVARLLTDGENACAQAKDLSYRLLTFSKGGEPLRKVLPLPKILRNAVLFSLSGSNVLPEFFLPDDLPLVAVDEGQIKQVINNLVMNAREAMPAGGVLRVTGAPVMVKSGDALPLKQGPYLKLSFADTGVGMAADVVSRIFEPYFSTKEMGPEKGRGLGLAICYSVLRKHEGLITAASEFGKGTVFHVYLPLVSSENLSQVGNVPGAGAELAAKRRILFMDDEERVRTITKAILEFLKYEVECVKDGADAVDAYRRAASTGRPFDLVILDLTVPGGMGGLDAFNTLRAADPGVRAIVSSGYAEDPLLREYGNFGFAGALAKPYDVSKLRETIAAVLPVKT